jgi:sugar phosphate isomerase/epimerase
MKPSPYLINTSRKKAVGQLKAKIDEASEVGAQRVAFLSGKDPEDANRPAALDALIKSVKESWKYGRDNGIGLTCEIFDRSIDKKCLIVPTDYAAKLARVSREDYPDFGLMYDLSHMPLLSEKVEALGLIIGLLVHIHIGNCVTDPAKPGYGDLHPPFGWPGGSNDVPELTNFLQALFKIGYLKDSKKERPWIGFEVKPQKPSQAPEAVIAGTKRVWQEAWSRA